MKIKLFLGALLFLTVNCFGQQNNTHNLVIISLDGYRWQEVFQGADSSLLFNDKFYKQNPVSQANKYWAPSVEQRRKKLMPFFWSTIASREQLYGNRNYDNQVNVRNKYHFSYPGRSEILCGYYDPKIKSNHYPDNPNENVLEFINQQAGFNGKVVTFASWDAVSRIISRNRNKMLVNIPGEKVESDTLSDLQVLSNELQQYAPQDFGEGIRSDLHTFALAKSYVKANHPKVIHLDFADPDNYGHAGRYDAYLDAGHRLDAMIESLYTMMQQDDFYRDNTTFLIYTDHGRGAKSNWTSHGFFALRSGETWLAAIGPDTPSQGEILIHSPSLSLLLNKLPHHKRQRILLYQLFAGTPCKYPEQRLLFQIHFFL